MKIKISSKLKNGKFIHGELLENKKADSLIIFLSGLSGSIDLPLFESAASFFNQAGFNILRLSFCRDIDDKEQYEDSLNLSQMSLDLYVSELRNVIDGLDHKYDEIVLIGHSFGAIVVILFAEKYRLSADNLKLVVWDPSLLPWDRVDMEHDFIFNEKTGLYEERSGGSDLIINPKFYQELITTDILESVSRVNNGICIIAAMGSADLDAKSYFSNLKDKINSRLVTVERADHFFSNKSSQQTLFKETLGWLNNKR